ncbi:MAG: nuclear transport factor 2 family protein [Gemmatimonadaceae bacterium]
MTTRNIIQGYFDSLKANQGWESFLSEEIQFTNFTSPVRRTTGKLACLEALKRFYSMMTVLEIKEIIVDGSKACVLTRYELQPPGSAVFESHIAEVFEVAGDKITSFGIYFDSAPYPKRAPEK